jgi:threonylcarbamoyladenosine tRNA methylthiotransferase MtaB
MINLAKKENPKAQIILTGCCAKGGDFFEKEIEANNVFKIDDLNRDLLKLKVEKNNEKILYNPTERSRYFIKIQDGCEQFCTYCIIPYLRGKLQSRPEKEVVEEIKIAVKNGYKEIVLTGIHLGLYGKERGGKTNLSILLSKIVKIKGLGRVRLSSIEITEVTDDLINLMKNSKKICQHLHLPLQAGNDKILKLMKRPYNKKYFSDRVKKIRQAMPDIAITTDVIVGFPKESKKDFTGTYNFVKNIKFSGLHIFSFSAHKITPAFKLKPQIKSEVKKIRAEELRKLGRLLATEYQTHFKNKKFEVIIEKNTDILYRGKTQFYFDVKFSKENVIRPKSVKTFLPKMLIDIIL